MIDGTIQVDFKPVFMQGNEDAGEATARLIGRVGCLHGRYFAIILQDGMPETFAGAWVLQEQAVNAVMTAVETRELKLRQKRADKYVERLHDLEAKERARVYLLDAIDSGDCTHASQFAGFYERGLRLFWGIEDLTQL